MADIRIRNRMESEAEPIDAQNKMRVEMQGNRVCFDKGGEKLNIAAKNLEQTEETLAEGIISYNVALTLLLIY